MEKVTLNLDSLSMENVKYRKIDVREHEMLNSGFHAASRGPRIPAVVHNLNLYPTRSEYEVIKCMYLLSVKTHVLTFQNIVSVNDGVRNSVFIWWKLLMVPYSDAKRT
jgi:hypothetical protein